MSKPIIIPKRTIPDGSVISLRGDTGKYMSRMGPEGLELSKEEIDQYSRFTVELITMGPKNMLALRGDTGKYMSRMGPERLELSKEKIDRYSLFLVVIHPKS